MMGAAMASWANDARSIVIADIQRAILQNKRSNACSIILNGTLQVNNTVDKFRVELFLDCGSKGVEPRLMIREFVGPENGQLRQLAATWITDETIYAYSFNGNAYSATPFGPKTRTQEQTAISSLLEKLNASTRNQIVHLVKILRDVYVRPAANWAPWQPTAGYSTTEQAFKLEAGNRSETFSYGLTDPDPDILGDEWLSSLHYGKREQLMGQNRVTKWAAFLYPGSIPNDPGTFSFNLPVGARLVQPGR